MKRVLTLVVGVVLALPACAARPSRCPGPGPITWSSWCSTRCGRTISTGSISNTSSVFAQRRATIPRRTSATWRRRRSSAIWSFPTGLPPRELPWLEDDAFVDAEGRARQARRRVRSRRSDARADVALLERIPRQRFLQSRIQRRSRAGVRRRRKELCGDGLRRSACLGDRDTRRKRRDAARRMASTCPVTSPAIRVSRSIAQRPTAPVLSTIYALDGSRFVPGNDAVATGWRCLDRRRGAGNHAARKVVRPVSHLRRASTGWRTCSASRTAPGWRAFRASTVLPIFCASPTRSSVGFSTSSTHGAWPIERWSSSPRTTAASGTTPTWATTGFSRAARIENVADPPEPPYWLAAPEQRRQAADGICRFASRCGWRTIPSRTSAH